MHAGQVGQHLAHFDITVSRFRRSRSHSEGDEPAGASGRDRLRQGSVEGLHIADRVVCGEHPQNGVGILLRHQKRRRSDGRGGIAPDRLQQDARAFDAGRAHLLGNEEAVLVVAHQDGRCELVPERPKGGVLKQRTIGNKRPGPLGEALPRNRPKPRSRAPGQDDGNDSSATGGDTRRSGFDQRGSGGHLSGSGQRNEFPSKQSRRRTPGSPRSRSIPPAKTTHGRPSALRPSVSHQGRFPSSKLCIAALLTMHPS